MKYLAISFFAVLLMACSESSKVTESENLEDFVGLFGINEYRMTHDLERKLYEELSTIFPESPIPLRELYAKMGTDLTREEYVEKSREIAIKFARNTYTTEQIKLFMDDDVATLPGLKEFKAEMYQRINNEILTDAENNEYKDADVIENRARSLGYKPIYEY
jgi:hypothetical protein